MPKFQDCNSISFCKYFYDPNLWITLYMFFQIDLVIISKITVLCRSVNWIYIYFSSYFVWILKILFSSRFIDTQMTNITLDIQKKLLGKFILVNIIKAWRNIIQKLDGTDFRIATWTFISFNFNMASCTAWR